MASNNNNFLISNLKFYKLYLLFFFWKEEINAIIKNHMTYTNIIEIEQK